MENFKEESLLGNLITLSCRPNSTNSKWWMREILVKARVQDELVKLLPYVIDELNIHLSNDFERGFVDEDEVDETYTLWNKLEELHKKLTETEK